MKCDFIPSDSLLIGFIENHNYELTWWNNKSHFNYNYLLISAYHGKKYDNMKEILNPIDNFEIIGDSGGFQNMSLKAILKPIDVLRWQEKNCTIGLTFDLPILKDDNYLIKKEKQIETVKNAYIALNERQNKKLKLYAVFQGHTIDEQKFIFNEYKLKGNISDFDGFAIGGLVPLKNNVRKLLLILLTFIENIKEYKKPIHFFGLSGRKIVPLFYYLSLIYEIDITYDSSSMFSGSLRREYWVNYIDKKYIINKDCTLKELPCNCDVCKNYKIKDLISNENKSSAYTGRIISLHNLVQMINYTEKLKKLTMNDLKQQFPKLKVYFTIIDIIKKYGINDGLKKCGLTHKNNIEQISIFR